MSAFELPSPVEMIELAKTDPRWVPYCRNDGWGKATTVHPDPNNDIGWLCPDCRRNTLVFYGHGPEWDSRKRRYVKGTADVSCRRCWQARYGANREQAA